jgi:hypothetical protein
MFGRGRLLRENVNMREALSFYAAAANWRRRAIHAKGMPKRWDKSPAAYDRGDRAIAAILAIENARARRGVLQQLRNLFRRKPKPRQIHVPAPLTLTPPTPKASPCLDQPTSSTEFSTTELPIDVRSGKTDASVDTPAATP